MTGEATTIRLQNKGIDQRWVVKKFTDEMKSTGFTQMDLLDLTKEFVGEKDILICALIRTRPGEMIEETQTSTKTLCEYCGTKQISVIGDIKKVVHLRGCPYI